MKRKNIIILLIILLALTGFYWYLNQKGWNTMKITPDMLSVKDTASITRIFMANKNGKKVLLERNRGQWLANGQPADLTKVNLILQTLYAVKVLKPVEPGAVNSATQILAVKGIKTEIYAGNKLLKTIYVGSETPDQTGTIMLLDGSNEPVIAHVPGFVGYLTPRFIVDPIKLKSRLVFNHNSTNISELQLIYPAQPSESFTIKNGKLFDANGNSVNLSDSNALKFYLNGFTNLYLEGYLNDWPQNEQDSVLNLQPYCIVKLTDTQNITTTLKVFYKPVGKRTKERYNLQTNEAYTYDTEKYFAQLNNLQILAMIQEFSFGRILVKLSQLKGIKVKHAG
jgi:hypothetical protein